MAETRSLFGMDRAGARSIMLRDYSTRRRAPNSASSVTMNTAACVCVGTVELERESGHPVDHRRGVTIPSSEGCSRQSAPLVVADRVKMPVDL